MTKSKEDDRFNCFKASEMDVSRNDRNSNSKLETYRPKSVRNRCLIELFVALFVLSLCPFDISVGVGAFVIGLGQISSFLPQSPKARYRNR